MRCADGSNPPNKLATPFSKKSGESDALQKLGGGGTTTPPSALVEVTLSARRRWHARHAEHRLAEPQPRRGAASALRGPRNFDEHEEARAAFDQRRDVAVVGAGEQIAFPVAGDRAVRRLGRPLTD